MKQKAEKPVKSEATRHKKILRKLRLNKQLVLMLVPSFLAFMLIAVLVRTQLTAATAVQLKFLGCTAIADRGLKADGNGKFYFRVTTETDDTFLMEDFGIKQPMKAGKSHLFSVRPTEPRWYGFKLQNCKSAGGAVIALKADGSDPPMGHIRYMEHGKDPEESHEHSDKESQYPQGNGQVGGTHTENH
jgi:hypothetical protein